jgi:hypothetical protein
MIIRKNNKDEDDLQNRKKFEKEEEVFHHEDEEDGDNMEETIVPRSIIQEKAITRNNDNVKKFINLFNQVKKSNKEMKINQTEEDGTIDS